ncbi:MAG: methionine--tRNA ligase [Bacteroidales bacterium]|nr:methionine--tRNA ligase [Bacteroidales bacterium]MBR5832622.1 methionine--tRNA ligase [Bacteroidales bacterium]
MTYTDKEQKFKRYTITSALPYANGPVHIGHLAGVYVPADIYARYLRSVGEDVIFIGGSDEHGVPITIKARKEGVEPQDIVDRYHEIIKKSFAELGVSFDIYSRTSSAEHHKTAAEYFKKLYDEGKFVEKLSMQYYDEDAGQFLADRYITGTCPHCGNEHAYGDQCEACGTSLNATDLINPKSTLSGAKPVLKETKHWFLALDKDEEWLRQWILEGHKNDWKTNVYGQCKSWIDAGLQPRAVTRDLDWGVKVPIEGADGKVLYVWFDAPIGYISFTKELTPEWEKWWKNDDTKLVHFIGKDNIVFHCIIFPSMLKADGSYILPENVPANEFLNLENDKISTSRNWAVWLHEYLQDFPGKQDVLRYTLCANAPETKDNNFTWKDFQDKNNNELVAIFGNFVNRTMVLTHKFFEGKVPAVTRTTDLEKQVIEELKQFPERIGRSIENYRFREALAELMNLARLGNKYLTETEPWKLIKTDPEYTQTVLNISLQICANLAILCQPFVPFTAQKLSAMLHLDADKWNQAGNAELISSGTMLEKPELLFEKIEDAAIEAQLNKLMETKKQNELNAWQPAKIKENVAFDDFGKVDIRVGTVLECVKVPKADKLLQFRIDDGMGGRTIVSGIAKYYPEPEKLVGMQVCFIANFEPRKLKGVVSEGMILSAEDKDGRLVLITPSQLVGNGVNVG